MLTPLVLTSAYGISYWLFTASHWTNPIEVYHISFINWIFPQISPPRFMRIQIVGYLLY